MHKLQCMCSNIEKCMQIFLVLYYFWQLQNSHIPLPMCIIENKDLQRVIAQNGLHQSCSCSSSFPCFTNARNKDREVEVNNFCITIKRNGTFRSHILPREKT